MTRTPLTARLAALALGAAVVLTGCGASPDDEPTAGGSAPDASRVLGAASDATARAGTARLQIRTQASAGEPGSSFSSDLTVEGVVDFASGDRQIVTELPTGGTVESRSIGGTLYTRLPEGTPGAQDQPWLKIEVPKGAGGALSGVDDASSGLTLLRDAAGPVTEVGRERVRDADTVHYRAEVDLTKLPAPSPSASDSPDTGQLLRQLLGDEPLPVDVWVDDQQRIRRLTLVLPLGGLAAATTGSSSQGAGQPGATSTATTEFYDFGVAVDVQPPPADEVREAPVGVPGSSSGSGAAAPSPSPTS